MDEMAQVVQTGGIRASLPKNSTGFLLVLEAVAAFAASVIFGLPYWVPVLFLVVGWWMMAQFHTPAGAMIAGNGAMGMAFAEFFFGFPDWISGLVGTAVVALLSLSFSTGGGSSADTAKSADANPIPYIVALVATRAFLALKYATVAGATSSTNIFDWVGLFVFGAIPNAPTIINVIFVMALQGTLVVYLVLVIKRIVNPLAN